MCIATCFLYDAKSTFWQQKRQFLFLSLYLSAYKYKYRSCIYIKYWTDAVIVAAAVDVVECKTACLRFASENK